MEIGGFIGWEPYFERKGEYHHSAIKVNSGRNALKYILLSKKYRKIYLPYFICDSVLEPIKDLHIDFEYYYINSNFTPLFSKQLLDNEVFLYVNYFGINEKLVNMLTEAYKNVIIDNTQSFFSKPKKGVDVFYSPRKFFGVADGGYLYSTTKFDIELERELSYHKYGHLLKRFETSANESYRCFLQNEESFNNSPLMLMSKLTQVSLETINYTQVKLARERNFLYLHSLLSDLNELVIDISNLNVPMSYPLLINKLGLKDYLIENKVYIPRYWKEVLNRVDNQTVEYYLTNNLVTLPMDQRYDIESMKRVVSLIRRFLN